MRRARGRLVAVLVVAGVGAAGCGGSSPDQPSPPAVKVTPVAGTQLKKLVLSQEAAERLGITIGRARLGPASHGKRLVVVPFDAIIYDPNGSASVFTNPARLTYIRHPVKVDRVAGEQALIAPGVVAPGAAVVTEGASELLGAETGVEE
jgi:multidrug efflux pump subunit AcrA (membrane-fusion protein)